MNTDCLRALEALHIFLQAGGELDEASRRHLETCPHCREHLASLLGGPAPESTPAGPDPASLEATAGAHFRIRQRHRAGILGLALATVILGGLGVTGVLTEPTTFLLVALGVAILASVLAISLVRIPGRYGLYKRLCKGRQLSGVCLGLSQVTGTPVGLWRAGFLLLAFFYGSGIWIYILMDLVMPVHPEDRPGLFRFRVARWWRGLRGASS